LVEAMFDACVIGHVVRDENVISGAPRPPAPGGAAYYSSMVYARLGLHTAVVTKVARADEELLLFELRDLGVEVFNLPTARSTVFRNIHAPEQGNVRVQRVGDLAIPLEPAEIPAIRSRIWQLGPLTNRDFRPEMTARCLAEGGLVGMDVQGLIRAVVDGEIHRTRPARGDAYLEGLDALKADEDEMLIFTGQDRIPPAAESVRRAGVREVLVTKADRGSTIFGERGAVEIAAVPPRRDVDATGCGDTYLAAWLARRIETSDLAECGAFASAVASIKIEGFGAFQGSPDEITARRATSR
jgi:sugar/nucleoside kinase (ribokinase family)